MKTFKACIFLMAILLTPAMVQGQFFNAGFKLGVNTNQFITSSPNFQQSEPELGFAGGMFLRFKAGAFSLQPEMLLSHKSGLLPYSMVNSGIDTFFRASMQNLDFPIIANLHLGKHVRFGTGPVVSYEIREKVTFHTSNTNYAVVIEKDVFKSAAYSWQFAGALEFRRIFLEARYELGIDKLNYEINIPGEQITVDPLIHSRTWQFTLGYKFVTPRK
ncbi:MAG: porin family protein [Bacteroidales bacterium]